MRPSRLRALKELRRLLQMREKSCSFDSIGPWLDSPEGRLPTNEREVTAFIRERTRLWRESWILPVLEQMIESEQQARKKRQARRRT